MISQRFRVAALRYSIRGRNLSANYGALHSINNQIHPRIESILKENKADLKAGRTIEAKTLNSSFSRGVVDESSLMVVAKSYKTKWDQKPLKELGKWIYLGVMIFILDRLMGLKTAAKIKSIFGMDDIPPKPKKAETQTEKPVEKPMPTDKHGQVIKSKYFVENTGVKFEDVRGIGDERSELQDVVDFMRDPDKFNSHGARLPKGVLLSGPPGVGKTMLAKAVANEADVPFFHIDGSSVEGPYVGTGMQKLTELFEAAKKHAPSIVFIDEIDAIGGRRTTSDKYPHARSTINTLLSLMDGFDKEDPVVVLGSTNMPDVLDEALLRSGRFDLKIDIPRPLRHQREQILQYYLGKLQTTVDINVDDLARITGGKVPADFKNLANTAGRIAVAKGKLAVTQVDLVEAHDQMGMGIGRRSELKNLSKETIKNTAWHEAGHALCLYLRNRKSMRTKINMVDGLGIHKITIIPRGGSGGHTAWLQADGDFFQEDTFSYLCAVYGGYVGEMMCDGVVTTGPSGDFSAGTRQAQSMVFNDLMSKDKLGRLTQKTENAYANLSDEEKEAFDKKVVDLTNRAYQECKALLEANRPAMKAVAEALEKYDQITFAEMVEIVDKCNPMAGDYLRADDDPEMNKKRIIKPKGVEPNKIPESVLEQNRSNLSRGAN